jgi:hypothetical protein
VGPAIKSLRDLDPNANVGVLRGHPRAVEILKEKWADWLSAQAGLEVLGAMHPDSDVSRLSESVITGGPTSSDDSTSRLLKGRRSQTPGGRR